MKSILIFLGQFSEVMNFSPLEEEKYSQKTKDRIAISLMRMFKLGPLVSFRGSPIESPITAAL